MIAECLDVATQVIEWQTLHGRHHLPWQKTRDPYCVWLSEIMLQQTQVSTVLNYYARFLERFPNVQALALASQDEVMGLWSGLGYYSRARNLHRCAQKVLTDFGGNFPQNAQALATLPGIGRSTAGAIAAFCFGERVAILDANVRRVLTRLLGIAEDMALMKNQHILWAQAEMLLPRTRLDDQMPRYTQGLMDLGATICTPRQPACLQCPLQSKCVAFQHGNPEKSPIKTKKISRRPEKWWLLLLEDSAKKLWLIKRPQQGIWSGLHCPPVFLNLSELHAYADAFAQSNIFEESTAFLHTLTHRDLYLYPITVRLASVQENSIEGHWYSRQESMALGLPAPIRKLLLDKI